MDGPRIIAIGTATPLQRYQQNELPNLFGIDNSKITNIFNHSHIETRYLSLPEPQADNTMPDETPAELLQKHKRVALAIGQEAIAQALLQADGLTARELDYIAVASTTGLLCPGLTAHYIKALNMRGDIHRIDVVGMGCNAGLNAMQPVVNYCRLHPQAVGLLVCVEVCSAMYVMDDTINTAVVNSLFGDGAAAAVISSRDFPAVTTGPKILGFTSHIVPEAIGAMGLDFINNKHAFYLDRQTPYLVGANIKIPVDNLLASCNLKIRDIRHWVIHSGGNKVIDSIKYALNISEHDVRHTTHILRHYGNPSSSSFLFSHDRLLQEQIAEPGDLLVMITMGPGLTIECCLGEF